MKVSFQYSEKFDVLNEYKGNDLGVNCSGRSTTVKLWAPFAEQVEMFLYSHSGTAMELPTDSKPEHYKNRIALKPMGKGVWQEVLPENLHGTWYDFVITQNGEQVRTADPYAKACAPNGCRSMAVDLSLTDPKDFALDKAPELPGENVIYEVHIKDFSMDPKSKIPAEYQGKYKAFTVEGTGDTCVDYLKTLGVTHVHILPFFDFGFLDETGDAAQFNWGYDPLNYNVPEGSYATDVTDGCVRIRECKEMIQALHRAGIRVIMDVVYNHTHEAESWLERTAPGYFCRRNVDGSLSDGSACGNDMAVGRAMVDNYIYHSVLYWAKEYHLDGFRFDLMGLLTVELMNRIRKGLDQEYGRGEKLLYGEPWSAGPSPLEAGTHAANKANVGLLDSGIAVFSDNTRDTIKGDVFFPEIPGFVNGGKGLEEKVLAMVDGFHGAGGDFAPLGCSQVINYVSAHDNFTLWDKLSLTMREGKLGEEDYLEAEEHVLAANKLAALIVFTCQGHLFFQAGEEFGRTKFGDENSYRSSDSINRLRWGQQKVFAGLAAYYRGLIALRKSLPGLCDKTAGSCRRIGDKRILCESIVSFTVDQKDLECEWKSLQVVYNASEQPFPLELPKGDWYVLADGEGAGVVRPVKDRVTVCACSGLILAKR